MENELNLRVIDVQKLKLITNVILDRLINKLQVREVNIDYDKDYYWDLYAEDIFKVKEDQPKLGVGRLADDWEFLQSILEDSESGVSLMLIHVAPLLRFIGEKIGQ